jgi:hypothetical protein
LTEYGGAGMSFFAFKVSNSYPVSEIKYMLSCFGLPRTVACSHLPEISEVQYDRSPGGHKMSHDEYRWNQISRQDVFYWYTFYVYRVVCKENELPSRIYFLHGKPTVGPLESVFGVVTV